MTDENTRSMDETPRKTTPDAGQILDLLTYAPALIYLVATDLTSPTPLPFGWSFEFIMLFLFGTYANVALGVYYNIDCWTNLNDELEITTLRIIGAGAFALGTIPVVIWAGIWAARGIPPMNIFIGIATVDILPIDFVFGAVVAAIGTGFLQRSLIDDLKK